MTIYIPYIQPAERVVYGLGDATDFQVNTACRIVDSYIGKPEGLIWTPDANGIPAFMANLSPTLSFKLPSQITPGSNVNVSIPNAQFGFQNIGEVVILDRATANLAEACVVTAASGNTITLGTVQFTHADQATMDFGLTLLEESTMKPDDYMIRLSRAPVAQILAAFTRAGAGKRPYQITDSGYAYESLYLQQSLSSPPSWTQLDLTQCDINLSTGVVWMLPGLPPHARTDVRMRYVAGWGEANVPWGIKQAVANIVRAAIDTPSSGNVKVMKSGDATLEFFNPGSIDADTKALLQPYRTMRIG